MAVAFKQKVSGTGATVVLNSVVAGNALFLMDSYFRGTSTGVGETTPTDSNGTFSVAAADAPGDSAGFDGGTGIFYQQNVAAGTHTVTPQANTSHQTTLLEFEGLSTTGLFVSGSKSSGKSQVGGFSGSSQATGTTSTAAGAGDLALISLGLACGGAGSANVGFTDPVSGYTTRYIQPDDATSVAAYHSSQTLGSGGTQSATFNWTDAEGSQFCAASIATFVAASAGSVTISPANASLVIAGQAPVRLLDNPRSPANASLTLTAQAPTFIGATQYYNPALAALLITGQSPTIPFQIYRLPSNGSLTLTGQIPSAVGVQGSPTISPALASLVLTGQAPTFLIAGSLGMNPSNASLTITSQVPVLDAHIIVPEAALTAQLVWVAEPTASGYDVGWGTTSGVYNNVVNVGNVTEYLLGSIAPLAQGIWFVAIRSYDEDGVRGSYGTQIVFNADGLVIAPQSVSMDMTITANAGVTQLVISGRAPFPFIPAQYAPGSASLVITGQAPTLQVHVTKSPAFASLVITGQTPNASVPGVIGVNFTSLVLTGGTPALLFSHNTFPAFGSLTITGQAPTLGLSSNSITLIPNQATLTLNTTVATLHITDLSHPRIFRGRVIWAPKLVNETKRYYFDASQLFEDNVLTIDVTASVYSGTDPSPSSIISSVPGFIGDKIGVDFTGGIAGVLYDSTCTITTTDGATLSQTAVLYVET